MIKKWVTNTKAQQAVEYIVLFVIVMLILVALLSPGGLVTSETRKAIDRPFCWMEETLGGKCKALCDNGLCESGGGEDCWSCPEDCGFCVPPACGDGLCNGTETCSSCVIDCGACPPPVVCGDGFCNGAETCLSCATDCGACPPPPPTCGNGLCTGAETCLNCATDCGACPPVCGDGLCNGTETCSNCAIDCGACPVCGDGLCNGTETCSSCAIDCGACPGTWTNLPPDCPSFTCGYSTCNPDAPPSGSCAPIGIFCEAHINPFLTKKYQCQ